MDIVGYTVGQCPGRGRWIPWQQATGFWAAPESNLFMQEVDSPLLIGCKQEPLQRKADNSTEWSIKRVGGEGGILSDHPKKFSVVMVKLKSFVVNERIVEKPFCQFYWEI